MDNSFEIDEDLLQDLEELENDPEEPKSESQIEEKHAQVHQEFQEIYGKDKKDFIDQKVQTFYFELFYNSL